MKSNPKESVDTTVPASAPVVIESHAAQRLIDAARTIIEGFRDGHMVPGHEGPALPVRRPTTKELRTNVLSARTSPHVEKDLRAFMRDVPEPKRQRKMRVIRARKAYRLKKVTSRETLEALQSMTPAATSVVMYLASHPNLTVPELVVQLDLRRKTIENIVSQLGQQGIVESVNVKK